MQMTHDLLFFAVEHHHHLRFLHLQRNFLFLNLRQKIWIVLKQQMEDASFCFLYFPLSSLHFCSKYHHQFDMKSLLQQLPLPLSFCLQRLKLKSGIIRTQVSFLILSRNKVIFDENLVISINLALEIISNVIIDKYSYLAFKLKVIVIIDIAKMGFGFVSC